VSAAPTPMFPLGNVLLPGMVLPLHVFEPRYRALVQHCLTRDEPFGVTLIERGFEVGGGDQRFGHGTFARIAESEELPDGRWILLAVGAERLSVHEWLDDDPYPRAVVEEWPDRPAESDLGVLAGTVRTTLRRVLGLAAEIGAPAAPATVDLADDPVVLGWQAVGYAPFTNLDRHLFLGLDEPAERLRRIVSGLEDQTFLLEAQLGD
jgi:ATP-dependent Lon protease